MLFDLLQVATDLGCQMESLLSSVQQRQQHQAPTQQAAPTRHQANESTSFTSTNQRRIISSAGRNRTRQLVCKPLDLSLKSSSCEPSESSPELTDNHLKLHQDAPLNLVKNDSRDPLACLTSVSSASPASSSSSNYGSSRSSLVNSSSSSASCDKHRQECDNNNNNNSAIFNDQDHLRSPEEFRNSSNDVQISSTSGRQQRRRTKKSAKSSKSHLCAHCGRSFSRSDMLTRHSRLHSGLKPYQCAKCLQVFSRSDHLSTHERTHTGEKPYQCKFCSYSACRRDMITRHMRTHTIGALARATKRRRQ